MNVFESVLKFNAEREARLVRRKLKLLAGDPFQFFRGSNHLFCNRLRKNLKHLEDSPTAMLCGDLHIENFGTYRGDNRLVYFDVNDFDEATPGPVAVELLRFTTGLLLACREVRIGKREAATLCRTYLTEYRETLRRGHPRWLERATAQGPVGRLFQSLKSRSQMDFLATRTVLRRGRRRILVDKRRALSIDREVKRRITEWADGLDFSETGLEGLVVDDVAVRIAGNGSLGVRRYVLLVRGSRPSSEHLLLDLKEAAPSETAKALDASSPFKGSEADRIVESQRVMQAIPPAFLMPVKFDGRPFVLKELQPSNDRLVLERWGSKPGRMEQIIVDAARLTAWAHLRSCGRSYGSSFEKMADFSAGSKWVKPLLEAASQKFNEAVEDYEEFSAAYADSRAAARAAKVEAGPQAT